METVKFVPPGGHRACLSCSAAKAKCVFPEDDVAGVSDAPHAVANASLGDGNDGFEHHSHQFLSSGDGPAGASSSATHGDGVPAVPKCERCERLGRDCLLPARPRKKRRVGPVKSGAARSSGASHTSSSSGQHTISLDSPQHVAAGFISAFSVNVDRPRSAASAGQPAPSAPSTSATTRHHGSESRTSQSRTALPSQPSPISPPRLSIGDHGGARHPSSESPKPSSTPSQFAHPLRHPEQPPSTSETAPGATPAASPMASPPPPPPLPPQAHPARPRSPDPWHAIANAVLNMEEKSAEEILACYRAYFGMFNPAIDLSDNRTTAAMLKVDSPPVWLAIVCVTSYHDLERQCRIGKAFIIHLSEQLFQYGRKNLSLLQGILIFVNGCPLLNYVFPQFSNLLSVAMALTIDLGLDKLEYSRIVDQSPLGPHANQSYHGAACQFPEIGHSLEGRRALAGTYCLGQAFSHGGGTIAVIKFTPQLLECCKMMEARYANNNADDENGAEPGVDFYLAICTRLYYVIDRAAQVQLDADIAGSFAIPAKIHVEAFEVELKKLWESVPPQYQFNLTLRLVYHTAQLFVYKLGFIRPALAAKSDDDSRSDPDRDQSAINCLIALNKYIDVFFEIPVDSIPHLSSLHYGTLSHACVMLAMMTAYYHGRPQPPDTPVDAKLAPFNEFLESVAARYEEATLVPHPLGHALRNPLLRSAAAKFRAGKLFDMNDRSSAEQGTVAYRDTTAKLQSDSLVVPTVADKGEAKPEQLMIGSSIGVARNTPESQQQDLKKIIADLTNSETDQQTEQAEWWAWFKNFNNNMTRRESAGGSGSSVTGFTGSTTTGTGTGSRSSGSMAGSVAGSAIGFGIRRPPQWKRGIPSVASIDNLLNNRDQEPNYDTYIQQQKKDEGPP